MFLKRIFLLLAAGVGGMHMMGGTAGARDVYVDADATGPTHDGTSWCAAYLTLSDALAAPLVPFDTFRVANGTYTPDPAGETVPRTATFQLKKFLEIWGGYAGCGAGDPDERDPRRFETILSGDLDGDDDDLGGDNGENCYHVVTGSGTDQSAVLDGVTITAGNADGLTRSFEDVGAGVFNWSGGPTLRGCTITGNVGKRVGGIYNWASNLVLEDCSIIGNESGGSAGGLMDISIGYAEGATLINCLILDNVAIGDSGGGIYTNEAVTRLDNCTVYGNSAVAVGGGIYAFRSNVQVTNSILWGNEDYYGAGESSQIDGFNMTLVVNYCCVQDDDPDDGSIPFGGAANHNIDDDPLFVPGPAGCLYLSQMAVGEPDNSPCWDAGSDSAAALGFDATVTTRSDEGQDEGTVDIGFHYPVTGETFLMGDFDRDGDADLGDFAKLQNCFTGEGPASVPTCCRIFDFEFDDDIDLLDFAEFAAVFDPP